MSYREFRLPGFSGGLNLRDAPDVVAPNQAQDCLNVLFTLQGAVYQRPGYHTFTQATLTNRGDSLHPYYSANGYRALLVGAGSRLEALDASGAVVASATGLSGGPYAFVSHAAAGQERAYAANGTDTLRVFDGASWSAPTVTVNGTAAQALPKGSAVGVLPDVDSTRLAVGGYGTVTNGGPGGTASNPSRVHFANRGDPSRWEEDGASGRQANWVDISPGDGESIQALVAWRDLMFAFKESKFAVFYGPSTSGGVTELNHRLVTTGAGLVSPRAVAVAPEGVYFLDRKGVYITNGQEPRLISDQISPFFRGSTSPYWSAGNLSTADVDIAAMAWHDRRLYLAVTTTKGAAGANNGMFVFDTRGLGFDPAGRLTASGAWTYWDIPAADLVSWRRSNNEELVFAYATGTQDVGSYYDSSGDLTDAGNAISSRWRGGWADLGSPDQKTVREMKMWGEGQCQVCLSVDWIGQSVCVPPVVFGASLDVWSDGTDPTDTWGGGTTTNDLWGPAGATTPRLVRGLAMRGTPFSLEFRNSQINKTWAIHRAEYHLRETRTPNVVETATVGG